MYIVYNHLTFVSFTDGGNGVNFTLNVNTGVISAKTILAVADLLKLTLIVVATDNNKIAFVAEASVTRGS